MVKKEIIDMETKPNVEKGAITPPIAKNKIDTVNAKNNNNNIKVK